MDCRPRNVSIRQRAVRRRLKCLSSELVFLNQNTANKMPEEKEVGGGTSLEKGTDSPRPEGGDLKPIRRIVRYDQV